MREILRQCVMRLLSVVFSSTLFALFALLPRAGFAAAAVTCHYTYGGETRALTARVTDNPYTVTPVKIGSYCLLRVVLATRTPSIPYIPCDRD